MTTKGFTFNDSLGTTVIAGINMMEYVNGCRAIPADILLASEVFVLTGHLFGIPDHHLAIIDLPISATISSR